MIRNLSFAKRRRLIPLAGIVLLVGGILVWNPMAEKGTITGGETLVVERETPGRAFEPSAPAL